jgi:uncharacterized membrane protein
VLGSIFQILFKYPLLVFQEGRFVLGAPGLLPWAAALATAFGVGAFWLYRRARGRADQRTRLTLAALRTGALALVRFLLLRPAVEVSSTVPQENFVAVVVNDSTSMAIAEGDDGSRGERAEGRFLRPSGDLMAALSETFLVRRYAFSDVVRRVGDSDTLRFAGSETLMLDAVQDVASQLSSVPLSGIVLVTDGGESGSTPLAEALLPIQREGIPVFTVGMGNETVDPDLELGPIDVPSRALVGGTLTVDVLVDQNGYDGRTATVEVEDQGMLVAAEEVPLPSDGAPGTARVRIPLGEAGPRALTFRVAPMAGERLEENNVRRALVRVEDRRDRILYVEGEPRWEVKFLRQAAAADENLEVVLFQRSADSRFLRLGVRDGDELLAGFPRTREQLFQYQGLILGSVEADFFTPDQLSMVHDFVSQRGGGFLMLGGPRAFGAGGYGGTPVEDALPVSLLPGSTGAPVSFRVGPRGARSVHPITQIRDTDDESMAAWEALPAAMSAHPAMEAKPGATVVLSGTPESGGEEVPILAVQRFGRGRAAALTVEDSWTWQFHHDVPVDDPSHERFWRQLLRWMVEDVRRQVTAELPGEPTPPGTALEVRATVDDTRYLERNDGVVSATVTGPSGEIVEVALNWIVEEDGVYAGTFTPREEGTYEVEVEARAGGEFIGTDVAYFRSAPSSREAFEPGMKRPLLERIARETGGRFYTESTVSRLPRELSVRGGGITTVERLDVWDAPLFLILLLGLLSGEWLLRRRDGMA